MIALISAVIFCFLTSALAQQANCSTEGQFTAPAGSYVFSWSLQSNGMYVDCNVSVNTADNTWVAVGFSEDRFMPDTDVIIGANDGTDEFVEDRWNGQSRVAGPSLDPMQNIMDTSSMRDGNRLTISFTRPLVSPDTSGRDENLDVCRNVLWAFGGTTTFVNGDVTALGGHSNRGVFPGQLCLCTIASTTATTATPTMTPTATTVTRSATVIPSATPEETPETTSSAASVANVAVLTFIFIFIATIF
ncbi:PREDICTED: uncharacterized protein LOC109590933 [Amphimedon queenslandica]|uniref:DOMON domain-containing protein n=1 Tax=Amphimedon queenslandica TaxID=400682 RepID=A0A1X7SXL0_AMPQE|nr:PREDICTED: uncharacterized protein LOC109590933 [Amphimedon queenslandica]|eukprot:XP_019862330.1 PREDICTED: uncharacterized protein LOC109590933 [Amphimedon queenslandica]